MTLEEFRAELLQIRRLLRMPARHATFNPADAALLEAVEKMTALVEKLGELQLDVQQRR